MAEKRIYVVSDREGGETLVRATSRAQAVRHVARAQYDVRVASADDVAFHLEGNGQARVEDAAPEPANEDEGETAAAPASRAA